MKAKIRAISYYLPQKQLSNEDLNVLFPEWSVDKIADKTGIHSRPVAAEDEFCSDMAIKASEKLFSEHNISPNTIDFILLCTQSPDYILPTTACIVQHKLGIPNSVGALDFNLGCSGFVYGLAIAKGLINSGIARNILLITSETYSKHVHPEDKSNRTIFGDAAAAVLISADSGFAEILDFDLGTDGSGAENLIVKNGGAKFPKDYQNREKFDAFGNLRSDNNLYMNGSSIFNFTSTAVPRLVHNVLKKNSLSHSDINLYIFHQANRYMLNHIRKKLDIDESRFFYFLERCANTVSSTIPIALKEAMDQDKCKGSVLLAGFGVGYSWGGTILKFD